MSRLFELHPHGFAFVDFVRHLFFDGLASAGGWYASRYCIHLWHRVIVAVSVALATTLALVWLVG